MTSIALRNWTTEEIIFVYSWDEAKELLATGHYSLLKSGLPH